MAYQRWWKTIRDQQGNAVNGASCAVYEVGTAVTATIYDPNSDDASPSPISNPFITTANGVFGFMAADGEYDVQISGGSLATQQYRTTLNASTVTYNGAGVVLAGDLSAPAGAGLVGTSAGTVQGDINSLVAADTALDTRLDAVEVGQSAAVVGYDTQANLYANLVPVANSVAYVMNDPTPAKNGTYRKVGGTGTGSWVQSSYDRVALVETQAASTEVSWLGDGARNYSYLKKLSASDTVLRRTDWQGTWDLSSATRRIINKYSEPLLANLTKSATVTQGNLTDHGLSNGITVPAAAQLDYGFFGVGVTLVTGTKYSISVFVKMADSSQPVAGASSDATKDFVFNLGGVTIPSGYIYTDLGSGLWRVDLENVSVTVGSQYAGISRYATQSGKGFTFTGFSLWESAVVYPYIKNATATYLDVSDYTLGADGKVTITPTPESGAETYWVPTTIASKAEVTVESARIDALETGKATVDAVTREIRGAFTPVVQFTPANGVGEMLGEGDYNNAVIGVYETMTQDTVFDSIVGHFFTNSGAGDVEWRVWVRDAVGSFDTTAVTPDDSGVIVSGFPTANSEYTLMLNAPIYASSGKVVFLVFRKTDGAWVSIRKWTTSGPGGRHAFYVSTSTSWPTSLSVSSLPSFGQAAFQLQLGSAASASESAPVDVVLPPTIYAVVGRESNLYFDNIIQEDAADYRWDVACSQGLQQEERWTSGLTPSAGTTTLALNVYPKNSETAVGTASASLVVKAASSGTGLNRKVLVIGDSTTFAGTTTGELVNIFSADAMAITLLGTGGSGANRYEGIGGWTVNLFYTDPSSPFYFGGAFNFSTYMSTNGYASVDWVLINLGINDVFSLTSDAAVDSTASTMISQLEAMILNIHAFNANVRIGIAITTPPIATQDGFGTNYGCGQPRWRFKRNIVRLARNLINAFQGRGATVSKVYIVPISVCLDTLHNMAQVTVAVNSRNTATVTRLNNGVHPDTSGYYQCADAYYAFLKGNET